MLKFSACKLKIDIMDIIQVLNFRYSDGCFHRGICGLHVNMVEFRWMLLQGDLLLHVNTTYSSDGCFYRGIVAAHEHLGTTIQMDTEAEGLAEEPE